MTEIRKVASEQYASKFLLLKPHQKNSLSQHSRGTAKMCSLGESPVGAEKAPAMQPRGSSTATQSVRWRRHSCLQSFFYSSFLENPTHDLNTVIPVRFVHANTNNTSRNAHHWRHVFSPRREARQTAEQWGLSWRDGASVRKPIKDHSFLLSHHYPSFSLSVCYFNEDR